jgi:hypothetical protein
VRLAIVQSSYLPWKGYFDLIRSSDHFILLDDVQYSRGDWRNRNRIKTVKGLSWLTVPLRQGGTFPALIHDMHLDGAAWRQSHFSMIQQAYKGAPGWPLLRDWLKRNLVESNEETLSELNEKLTRGLCDLLGIGTPITRSEQYAITSEDPTERVVKLCLAVGATSYLSGPRARAYIREELFHEAGVTLEYFDYSGYPAYAQPHGDFIHEVSIVDTIACLGAKASQALIRPLPDSRS